MRSDLNRNPDTYPPSFLDRFKERSDPVRRLIPSNPALATVDAGERLFKASVADILEDYRAFLAS